MVAAHARQDAPAPAEQHQARPWEARADIGEQDMRQPAWQLEGFEGEALEAAALR
jgi:hypothetical protein